jgi:hypothetical protein
LGVIVLPPRLLLVGLNKPTRFVGGEQSVPEQTGAGRQDF